MNFDNHPPIKMSGATEIAEASTDGGSYNDIGKNLYRVMQGKRVHLYHYYSSGCEYNNRVDSSRIHLGVWDTPAELIQSVLENDVEIPQWASNKILRDLGYDGEEA